MVKVGGIYEALMGRVFYVTRIFILEVIWNNSILKTEKKAIE
jgi:hypothetical protein